MSTLADVNIKCVGEHVTWNWAQVSMLSYSGLLQSLLVLRVPPPQDREHSLYGPQGPHSP